jgi:hypothetical protein
VYCEIVEAGRKDYHRGRERVSIQYLSSDCTCTHRRSLCVCVCVCVSPAYQMMELDSISPKSSQFITKKVIRERDDDAFIMPRPPCHASFSHHPAIHCRRIRGSATNLLRQFQRERPSWPSIQPGYCISRLERIHGGPDLRVKFQLTDTSDMRFLSSKNGLERHPGGPDFNFMKDWPSVMKLPLRPH